MSLQTPKAHYTFADCLAWDESKHIEIINGEAIVMSTPLRIHQEICGELSRQLGNFLDGKTGEVILGPFAVRLFEKDGDPHAAPGKRRLSVRTGAVRTAGRFQDGGVEDHQSTEGRRL